MKKILLAVTAALAITGCSQNEEIENVGDSIDDYWWCNPILFCSFGYG